MADVSLVLSTTKLIISRGIFFSSKQEMEYISRIEIKPITRERLHGDPYSIIWLNLGRIETQTIIEYPKLPEILA
jgi:hypothetical protein